MIDAKGLAEHYRAVRERLQRPPNAIPDIGINLQRGKGLPAPVKELPVPPEPEVIECSRVVPFKRLDLTFSSTLEFAAKEFNITSKDIRTHRRIQSIALPRQIAIWIAHKHKLQSLSGMGKYLKMDHTTMIHARQKIERRMQEDATLKQRVLSLEAKILANYGRSPVPAIDEPHLESQENGRGVPVTAISAVDNSG